jgi:hypothetical protein
MRSVPIREYSLRCHVRSCLVESHQGTHPLLPLRGVLDVANFIRSILSAVLSLIMRRCSRGASCRALHQSAARRFGSCRRSERNSCGRQRLPGDLCFAGANHGRDRVTDTCSLHETQFPFLSQSRSGSAVSCGCCCCSFLATGSRLIRPLARRRRVGT